MKLPAGLPAPLSIAVLASGTGTNLQALLDTVHGREAEVVAVASNVEDAPALERARARGVLTALFPRGGYADREARDAAMAEWLADRGARLVVLAGYMELLSPAFLERFPEAVINVHPSLLPAFPGLRAIEQALAYGVKVFGVTVHLVDAGLDSGPVILQRALELPDARDPAEVLAALRPLEHTLLPQAVRLFARGAVSRDPANPRRVLIASDAALSRAGAGAFPRPGGAAPSRPGEAADG
jgi:phosphoribosylglycinamide formyltransferase 1